MDELSATQLPTVIKLESKDKAEEIASSLSRLVNARFHIVKLKFKKELLVGQDERNSPSIVTIFLM